MSPPATAEHHKREHTDCDDPQLQHQVDVTTGDHTISSMTLFTSTSLIVVVPQSVMCMCLVRCTSPALKSIDELSQTSQDRRNRACPQVTVSTNSSNHTNKTQQAQLRQKEQQDAYHQRSNCKTLAATYQQKYHQQTLQDPSSNNKAETAA